jgi:phage regulator Rha-like protein
MTQILKIIDNEAFVSHRVIAKEIFEFNPTKKGDKQIQLKNKMTQVKELITDNLLDFEEFGHLRFETESVRNSVGAVNQEKTYFLNEQQATLLMTYLRNSEIVRNFKKELVKQFFKMREILNSKNSNEPDLEQIRKRTELIEFSERQFSSFKKIFLEIGISEKNELAITSNRAVAKETGIDFIQLAGLKGLEAKEKFYSVTELCEVVRNSNQFANEFKISVSTKNGLKPRPQNLNLLLEISEFQFRENGEWKLTEKGEDFGKLSQNKSKYSEKTVYHLVWSKRVLELLK